MPTASLPAKKTDASLSSIVAEPGTATALAAVDLPPPEAGTLALREAAARGDARAQFIIASRFLDGEAVAQDLPKAAQWYQQAAARGLAPAQYRLATMFERGKGVPQDLATALLWYERAAASGNIKSMHNAAVIAAGTQVGTPNYDKAFRLFKDAAEHGLHDSQFNLAVLYERGLGTKQDNERAYFWYAMAGRQGDADAGRRAEALALKLEAAARAAEDAKITAFQAKAQVDAANLVAIADPSWESPVAPPAAVLGAAEAAAALDTAGVAPDQASQAAGEIAEAQRLLTELGFNIGTPDGKMGSRTANAIRLFQLQSGLKVTGEVTPELLAAMRAKAG
jgi:localization factor PodJL